jgi:preprotein translocase subunit SecA
MDRLLADVAGRCSMRLARIRRFSDLRVAKQVVCEARALSKLDDATFDLRMMSTRARLWKEGPTGDALACGLAVAAECARRMLGQSPYPVQIAGVIALIQGRVVEMATGEGKSLTAAMAAAIVACGGIPVDIFTVNDYLARRDATAMLPFFDRFGLSVSSISASQTHDERLAAYASSVLYVVNKDYVFDYLRHRSAKRLEPFASRGLFFAIVDEADSLLVDEATTPLILAREVPASDVDSMPAILETARSLRVAEDFLIDPVERKITLLDSARTRIHDAQAMSIHPVLGSRRILEERAEQALRALHLYQMDRDYVVQDGKIQIVDEDTGRLLHDRTWQRGLHQFIELKEKCALTGVRETIARITYPQFFRRYLMVSGMSGTVAEVCGEIRRNYGAQVVRLPTHRPVRRKLLGPLLFRTSRERWLEVVQLVQSHLLTGQAVLIGTRSVLASEEVSRLLQECGIAHEVLNARDDSSEAAIVANAGHVGRVTVATNMAGRGTDIVVDRCVEKAGGLVVILTEFHGSSRVDRQLFGRCARQGDRGVAIAVACLDDELFQKYLPKPVLRMSQKLFRRGPLPWALARMIVSSAQSRASRHQTGIRDMLLASDDSLREQLGFTGDLV